MYYLIKKISISICAVLLAGSFPTSVSAAESLNFTMRADSEAGKLGTQILKVAYERLGISINISGRPGVRAITEANNGVSDGEVVRLPRVLKNYPNLRVVPEYLMMVESLIASKNHSIKVAGWETVKNYSATTVRGYRSIERRLKGQESILSANVKTALKLVERDRVEILVLTRFDIMRGLKATGYKNIKIIEPPISSVALHHLLHKKHEALIPRVNAALKAMKADGSLQKITAKFLAGYLE